MSNFISISQYNKATHGSEVVVKCYVLKLICIFDNGQVYDFGRELRQILIDKK